MSRKPSWLRLPCARCGTEIPDEIEYIRGVSTEDLEVSD